MAGVAGVLLLGRFETRSDRSEVALWLASLVLLAAGGLLGRRATAFPARWETHLPRSRAGRAAFLLAAIAALVAAAAARVWAVDRIPIGINNADEGDRAAAGIAMLGGDWSGHAFGSGWYHVSNVYFWILARTMDVFGLSVGGARMLGALCGLLTVGLVLLLALRPFGWRVALMAECFAAFCGVALQFSRETTEATPTATLWTLAALFLLEAARAGPAWAWVGAGLAGGLRSTSTRPRGSGRSSRRSSASPSSCRDPPPSGVGSPPGSPSPRSPLFSPRAPSSWTRSAATRSRSGRARRPSSSPRTGRASRT